MPDAARGRKAVVVGGGVAGIAAAVALADAGLTVELIEKRAMLGGRASSFYDHETGLPIDEVQHGTMTCCTNLADLLERLGVHHLVRYHDTIRFLDGEGRRSAIYRAPLPAPLHTSWSFLRFRSLGLRDKLSVARALVALLRTPITPDVERMDMGSWLRGRGVTERALARFLEPVLVSACNAPLDRIGCAYGFKVFRDGFLTHPRAYQFGVPTVALGELYTEPTVRYLEERGGRVRLRTIVGRIVFEAGRASGVALNGGEAIGADIVVSGLQFDLLLRMLGDRADHPYFEPLRHLELAPIVGVHVWFGKAIETDDCVALLDRRTDWVFNRTRILALRDRGVTLLSLVISADEELAAMPKDEALALVLRELAEAIPETAGAPILKSYVVRERKATFVPAPGVDALRPDQRSPYPGFYVAGEWTQTGWPSTMESAARSGYLAAERALEDLGAPRACLAPDLRPSWLARRLMR